MLNPNNFKVTNISEQTKLYCFYKFGYEDLAEYFYSAFVANWKDRIEDGSSQLRIKWSNPDLALKRWVRYSSPVSPARNMFNVSNWERAIAWCKAKQYKESINVVIPEIKTTPMVQDKRIAYKEVAKMLKGLKT